MTIASEDEVSICLLKEPLERRQYTSAVGTGASRDIRVEGERLELVRHTGAQVELDLDASAAETLGVGKVLVAEYVELSDLDVGGRQPREVGRAGRGGVRRNVWPADRITEQRALPGAVVVIRPEREWRNGRIGHGVAVVEHRIDQYLPSQGRAAPVAGQQSERRGQTAAAAVAHDRDPARVDAQLGGVRAEPAQPRIAGFRWGVLRCGML